MIPANYFVGVNQAKSKRGKKSNESEWVWMAEWFSNLIRIVPFTCDKTESFFYIQQQLTKCGAENTEKNRKIKYCIPWFRF